MPVRVPIEDVRRGDEIELARVGRRVVSDVRRFEDVFVLVYYSESEETFENRSGMRGQRRLHSRVVEKGLAPKKAGELVDVVARGSTQRADELRRSLEERRERLLEAG